MSRRMRCWVWAAVFFLMCGGLPHVSHAGEVLRLLVWEGYAPADQVARFEAHVKEKFKVDLKMEVRVVQNLQEFFDAARGGTADVITPSHNLIKDEKFSYIKKELIIPVDLNHVPNYNDLIPALKRADYITEGADVFGVPFATGPYGLVYNTGRVSPAPVSWNALWDSAQAGHYAVARDYPEVNVYIAALALGGYDIRQVNDWKVPFDAALQGKLDALAQNAGKFWKGVDTAEDLKGLNLATSWGFSLPELKKQGEIWQLARPKEGDLSWVDNYVLCRSLRDKPQMRQIGEEWLNFVLSPEYQVAVVARGLGSTPVNAAAKTGLSAEEIKAYRLDEPEYFRTQMILWPTITSVRTRNALETAWADAIKKANK